MGNESIWDHGQMCYWKRQQAWMEKIVKAAKPEETGKETSEAIRRDGLRAQKMTKQKRANNNNNKTIKQLKRNTGRQNEAVTRIKRQRQRQRRWRSTFALHWSSVRKCDTEWLCTGAHRILVQSKAQVVVVRVVRFWVLHISFAFFVQARDEVDAGWSEPLTYHKTALCMSCDTGCATLCGLGIKWVPKKMQSGRVECTVL